MKLLKIIALLFIVHFVRRFYQAYKAMKALQDEAALKEKSSSSHPDIIQADFKVVKD